MARVTGPSRRELDARGDEFAARVSRAIRTTLRDVAQRTHGVDDLTRIETVWRSIVKNSLAPHLRKQWNAAVLGVRVQLEEINERDRATLLAAVFEIPQVSNPLAETFLAEAQNRLTAIGDVVWYTARGEMLIGMQLGEGVAELRERVKASANVSSKRAEVIARTEVNSAMNNGAYEQMKALDVTTVKEWIATNDSRTRESHEEVDGEEIAGDAKFMVGGYAMDHPHDLNAPPSETINCRCTLAWEIVDDEDDYEDDLVASSFHLPGRHDQKKHGHRYAKPGDKSSGLKLRGNIKDGDKPPTSHRSAPHPTGTPLTSENVDAIKKYTNDSTMLNAILRQTESGRNHLKSNPGDAKYYQEQEAQIKDAMRPLEADTTVFRGVSMEAFPGIKSRDDLPSLIGKTIHDKAFTSTSKELMGKFLGKGADVNDHALLKITVPKNYPVSDVEQLSGHFTEKELLLDSGTTFVVKDAQIVELAPGVFRWQVTLEVAP